MKRTLALTALLGLFAAAPAAADAATGWRGVVVAKDSKRHALVTASRAGKVRTVRAGSAFRRTRVGARVAVTGRRLSDGTYRAQRVRRLGRARAARVRAVLVRNQRSLRRYVVSAGGSVFAIRARRGYRVASLQDSAPKPGDKVSVDVKVGPDGEVEATGVQATGHIGTLELEGAYLGAAAGDPPSFRIRLDSQAVVTVRYSEALPAGLQAGAEIEILVGVGADGTFTLISMDAEDGDEHGLDFEEDEGEIEVEGTLTALAPATVQPRSGSAVTCQVPDGVDLAALGFTTGGEAEMECILVDGVLVLQELESGGSKFELDDDDEEDDDDDDEDDDENDEDD